MAAYGLLGLAHEGLAGDLVKRVSAANDPAAAALVALAADVVFWRLWTRFDSMQEEQRVAALGGIKGLSSYLKDRLRVNLASSSTSHRLRAVRITGLLGLVDDLWRDMGLAARDLSPRVRSAAIRFLGRSKRPELRRELLAGLYDMDGRVQANAVEAIDESDWPDRLDHIVLKLDSEHSRVRAIAAGAMARAGDEQAVRILGGMLEHELLECRLTAIWAIRRIGAGPWAETLGRLAEHDPSPAVRRQARQICGKLAAAAPARSSP